MPNPIDYKIAFQPFNIPQNNAQFLSWFIKINLDVQTQRKSKTLDLQNIHCRINRFNSLRDL